eukprot:8950101-Lingulodinium_polyedra.AAC.2
MSSWADRKKYRLNITALAASHQHHITSASHQPQHQHQHQPHLISLSLDLLVQPAALDIHLISNQWFKDGLITLTHLAGTLLA